MSFSVTFNTAGSFSYHCNIHPFIGPDRRHGRARDHAPRPDGDHPDHGARPSPVNPATPPTSSAAVAVAAPTTLPHTGASNSGVLVALAVALTLIGGTLSFVASPWAAPAGVGP